MISDLAKKSKQWIGLLGLIGLMLCQTSAAQQNDEELVPVDFLLTGLDGRFHRPADYTGQWLIINFWASWCGPCVREVPQLNLFYRDYQDRGVEVLGVNYEQLTIGQIRQAAEVLSIEYPVLYLRQADYLSENMVLKGLPSTFVVDPKGRLIKMWTGEISRLALVKWIQPYLM